MTDREKNIFIAAGLVLGAVIGAVIIYLSATYEKEIDVIVENRWWSSSIAITYTTTHTRVRPVSDYSCSGYGENRSCTTTVRTEVYTETRRHTRCGDSATGTELPAVIPPEPCARHSGDSVRRGISYWVDYRIEETSERGRVQIDRENWSLFAPGNYRHLVLNIAGRIKEIS